jgi:hypothetical protein
MMDCYSDHCRKIMLSEGAVPTCMQRAHIGSAFRPCSARDITIELSADLNRFFGYWRPILHGLHHRFIGFV